jgi:hypothetical protein
VRNDFADIEDSISPIVSVGKSRQRTLQVFTMCREYEFEKLASLASAPKAYMYLGSAGDVYGGANWAEVGVNGGMQTKTRNKSKLISYEIQLPTLTMSL